MVDSREVRNILEVVPVVDDSLISLRAELIVACGELTRLLSKGTGDKLDYTIVPKTLVNGACLNILSIALKIHRKSTWGTDFSESCLESARWSCENLHWVGVVQGVFYSIHEEVLYKVVVLCEVLGVDVTRLLDCYIKNNL